MHGNPHRGHDTVNMVAGTYYLMAMLIFSKYYHKIKKINNFVPQSAFYAR